MKDKDILKKQIYYILQLNDMSEMITEVDNLIDEQGVEQVFNQIYHLFCVFGNTVQKKNRIVEKINRKAN